MDDEVVLTDVNAAPSDPPSPPPLPPPLSPAPGGTFYRVDSSRATFRELWRDSRSPAVLIAWATKLLRVKLPGSVNDPNVESLRPFVVDASGLPPEVNARFDLVLRELRDEGFEPRASLAIVDLFHGSRTYVALLAHRDGAVVGRIVLRTEGTAQKPKKHFFTEFLSGHVDGTFLLSSSALAVLNPPPGTRLNWNDRATPRQLWASHQRTVDREKPTVPVRGDADLLDVVERHHAAVREFNLARGVFAPMQAADRQQAAVIAETFGAAERGELAHPDVMAELHKLQTRRTNWVAGLFILVISLALFIGAGFARRWESLWLLVPLLFFHELGHYVAMRVFGYRNLQMFFIPFLGAAVSGQNYTAPGWKKVIVALMGPLPGVALGAVLGAAGVYYEKPMLINAAVLALILNGFNLLPVLPLDGGRVMHTLLFARHHLLDVTFRVLAAGTLAGLGALAGDKILLYFGLFMLIGIPAAYRLAKIATDLRRAGLRPGTLPADHVIPPEVAQPIIERVRAAFPRVGGPKMIAKHTLHVYETLATRPPGWVASIALGTLHAASFAFALLAAIVIVVAQNGSLRGMLSAAANMPQNELDPAAVIAWDAPQSPAAQSADAGAAVRRDTILATFDDADDAQAALDEVQRRPPPGARAVRFGQTLLLAIPASDATRRQRWLEQFQSRAKPVFVEGERANATLALTCIAPTAGDAEAIVAAINDGVSLGAGLHLIPPWHPADWRTPEQVAQHERARRTYAKLHAVSGSAWNDPRVSEVAQKVADAFKQEDEAAVNALSAEQARVYDEVRRESMRELIASNDPSLDEEFAERFLFIDETVKPDERHAQMIVAELGPRMGQVAMVDGRPAPGADRYAARFGFASQEGLIVTIRSMTFDEVVYGPPALVTWLNGRGCVDFRYQFRRGLFDEQDFEDIQADADAEQ